MYKDAPELSGELSIADIMQGPVMESDAPSLLGGRSREPGHLEIIQFESMLRLLVDLENGPDINIHMIKRLKEYRTFLKRHRPRHISLLTEIDFFSFLISRTSPEFDRQVRRAALAAIATTCGLMKTSIPEIIAAGLPSVLAAIIQEDDPALIRHVFRTIGNVFHIGRGPAPGELLDAIPFDLLTSRANAFISDPKTSVPILYGCAVIVDQVGIDPDSMNVFFTIFTEQMKREISEQTREAHDWALKGIVLGLDSGLSCEVKTALLLHHSIPGIIDRYLTVPNFFIEHLLVARIVTHMFYLEFDDLEFFVPLLMPIFEEKDDRSLVPFLDDFESILRSGCPFLPEMLSQLQFPAIVIRLILDGNNQVRTIAGRLFAELLRLSEECEDLFGQLVDETAILAIFSLLESDSDSTWVGLLNGLGRILAVAERTGAKQQLAQYIMSIDGKTILDEFALRPGCQGDVRAALSIVLSCDIECDATDWMPP
jgi:hypothetical protein